MIEKYFAIFEERYPDGKYWEEPPVKYRVLFQEDALHLDNHQPNRFTWNRMARLETLRGEAAFFLGRRRENQTPIYTGHEAVEEMDQWAEILPTLSDL